VSCNINGFTYQVPEVAVVEILSKQTDDAPQITSRRSHIMHHCTTGTRDCAMP
jgi:hypothetical protein